MKIEDSFTVPAPPETVWAFIRDPHSVAPCVPGCEDVEILGDNRYRAGVRVAIGPIKARFVLEVTVREEREPHFIASTTRGEEGSRASTVSAENMLRLEPTAEGGTQVFYSSEVSVVGRLGKFGLGIMTKKAESLGREFAAAMRKRLAEGAPLAPEAVAVV